MSSDDDACSEFFLFYGVIFPSAGKAHLPWGQPLCFRGCIKRDDSCRKIIQSWVIFSFLLMSHDIFPVR